MRLLILAIIVQTLSSAEQAVVLDIPLPTHSNEFMQAHLLLRSTTRFVDPIGAAQEEIGKDIPGDINFLHIFNASIGKSALLLQIKQIPSSIKDRYPDAFFYNNGDIKLLYSNNNMNLKIIESQYRQHDKVSNYILINDSYHLIKEN